VKGIYAKTGGWYGGDVVELVQIGPDERARRIVDLAGGRKQLREASESAYANGDRAWAAELARHLVRADPEDAESRALLAGILRSIGYDAVSANLRNDMLTEAMVLERGIDPRRLASPSTAPDMLRPIDDSMLFRALGVSLDPARSGEVTMTVGITLTDTGTQHTIFVRRGVLEWRAGRPVEADLRVELDRETWLAVAGKTLTWLDGEESGKIQAESGREALVAFDQLFDD
jgi:alkyl sulfatase BDS1-like metallo-beta-lactamase superfamily hydrolase